MDAATSGAGPDDGPAWPAGRWIFPTVLKLYASCPHRVRLRYIDGLPEPFVYSLHLIKGRIAHEILRQCAWRVARGEPVVGDDLLRHMVAQRFHSRDFPSPEAMLSHVDDVRRWVRFGIGHLDPEAEYLVIERNSNRSLTLPSYRLPIALAARSDLILLRSDHDGEPVVDFVDYKTGKPREDDIVPVFTRFVARTLLRQHMPDPTVARMRFTFLWLDAEERQEIDLSLDHCESAWEPVKARVAGLLAEREWPARPSSLCRFCPYAGNSCTALERVERSDSSESSLAVGFMAHSE